MENQFVPYELAVKLKELEFNEECLAMYFKTSKKLAKIDGSLHKNYYSEFRQCSGITSPLYQQAFDWFRKEHKLEGIINMYTDTKYCFTIYSHKKKTILDHVPSSNIYEEAREACLIKLIELYYDR